MKVATRNNLLTKLENEALALSYSTVEYAAPVWTILPHAKNLDPGLNQSCRSVTGCLKPTNVEDLYLLSGIVYRNLATRGNNTILRTPPPHISSSEEILPRLTRRGSLSSELIMCGGGVRSILLLPLVARCLETIDAYIYGAYLFLCLL